MAEFPMNMLRDLKRDWDSYGGAPIDEACIQKGYEIWQNLSGSWSVVPMSNGGIQLERHADGLDIEISIERARPQHGGEHADKA